MLPAEFEKNYIDIELRTPHAINKCKSNFEHELRFASERNESTATSWTAEDKY